MPHSPAPLRLGVNIDHVATIRNARGGDHPDPVKAALLAVKAGADGITAHLREDRRHIRDEDVATLMRPGSSKRYGRSSRRSMMRVSASACSSKPTRPKSTRRSG